MTQTVPIEVELLRHEHLPRSAKHSYCLLKAEAWDGQAAREVRLSFDELQGLWGDPSDPMSRTQAKEHLRVLKKYRFIQWVTNGSGVYLISFPPRSGAAGQEVKAGNPTLADDHRAGKPTLLAADNESGAGNPTLARGVEREAGIPSLAAPESESVIKTPLNGEHNDCLPGTSDVHPFWRDWLASRQAATLEEIYARALQAGGVYPNIVLKESKRLAAEGPDYLPHLLGHIAFAHSAECDLKPGAYVWALVQERQRIADPRWLPSPEMGFEAALAWARGGGQTKMTDAESAEESPLGDDVPAAPPTSRLENLVLSERIVFNVSAEEAWGQALASVKRDYEQQQLGWPNAAKRTAPAMGPMPVLPVLTLIRYVPGEFHAVAATAAEVAMWETVRPHLEKALADTTHGPQRASLTVAVAGVGPDESVRTMAGCWESRLSLGEVWRAAREQLALEMTRGTFDTWVVDVEPLRAEPNRVVLGVPNPYAKDWLTNRLLGTIRRTLSTIVGQPVDAAFEVRAAATANAA